MENKNAEEITKNIFSDSKLNIENPDFNKVVMDKIRRKNRKSILFYNIKLYSLLFVGIDVLIITLLRLFNISIVDIPDRISTLTIKSMPGQFIPIYFTFMIATIFLIIAISGNGYFYSKTHKIAD